MSNDFSKIIEHDGDKIEVYTYKTDKEICFFIEKDDYEKSESYFYLNPEKAKEFVKAINSAVKTVEVAENKSNWQTLKEFIKSEMNSDKVTLEDSCHYQNILNKMCELEENSNE